MPTLTSLVGAYLARGTVSWAGDESDPTFAAYWKPDVLWNGFIVPYLDRFNTQKLVDYNLTAGPEYVDQFRWDGDTLIDDRTAQYPGEPVERIEPILIDNVPHWTPGGFSWTWVPIRTLRHPGCASCSGDMAARHLMPPHDARLDCESGHREHCSCERCF